MEQSSLSKRDLRVVIITVSDSRHAGTKEDTSGKLLSTLVHDSWDIPVLSRVVSDDIEDIQSVIKQFSDGEPPTADLIITTGGTGFAERDVTPEATKPLLTKEAPGLVTALIHRGLQATPLAALSRLAAGIRGHTLIVNFPGSTKAVKECWEVLHPLVPHAVDLLRGNATNAESVHQKLAIQPHSASAADGQPSAHHQHHGHHHHHHHHHVHGDGMKSSVDTGNVASRPRESPYPMVSFEDALGLVLKKASSFPRRVVEVELMDALNRVLAEDIRAEDPQPPFPASIKDGYAVVAADGAGERKVLQTVATAGVWALPTLSAGSCMRISTGAPVPLGADAVVQVEDTKLLEEKDGEEIKIFINKPPVVGQDIRPVGSDVAADEVVLMKGVVITSAEIGILASVGKIKVPVYQYPIVAVMSTGDELIDPLKSARSIQSLSYGKIRDSNRPELMALLLQQGIDSGRILDAGICPDEPDALLHLLRKVFDQADILVTSGGVSMGERDLLKQILVKDLGFELHFARVQMKPGKPTTFATAVWQKGAESKPVFVFGLPGNPVSAWVTAQLYVLPTIRQIIGFDQPKATVISVKVSEDLPLDSRPEFVRAVFGSPAASDTTMVPSAVLTDSNQMSCRLLSNRQANLLLMLPARTNEKTMVGAGETVHAMIIGRL